MPFIDDLTATLTFDGTAFELSSLVAVIVYALATWALIKLIWLLFH